MLSLHARAQQFYFIDIRVGFSKMIFHVNNADAQKKVHESTKLYIV